MSEQKNQVPEMAVEMAQALIRCQSVTPIEGGALDYMQEMLESVGFTCTRLPFTDDSDTPDVDNLYARLGSGSPHLCYAGHTDVVPVGDEADWTHPPFDAHIDDEGILHGRGTADMKGGVASFMAAAMAFAKANPNPKGSISFLITGDEEGPAINGTPKMLGWLEEQGEKIDHCIVGEPTNTADIGDMIKVGRRGSMNSWLTVKGQQGHVAYQHLAKNPVPGLVKVLDAFKSQPLDEGSEHFQPSNLEVTNIKCPNEATNVIPAEVTAQFNIRFNDLHNAEGLQKMLHERAKAALEGTGLDYEIEFLVSGDSFVTEPGPWVQLLVKSIDKVTGLTPTLSTSGGTSDARFIKNICPVIEFGLVNKTIHQVNEHVPVAHIHTLTEVYSVFLEDYFAADLEA